MTKPERAAFIEELRNVLATMDTTVILVVIDQSTTTYINQHGKGNTNIVESINREQPNPP